MWYCYTSGRNPMVGLTPSREPGQARSLLIRAHRVQWVWGEVNAERSKWRPVRSSLYSYSHHSVNKEVVGEETRRLRHSWKVSGINGKRCELFAQDVGILVPTSRHLQSADCETSKHNIRKPLLLSSPLPSFCLSSIKSKSFLENLFQFQEKRTKLEA
jgi:hypothetical protein